MFIVRWMSPSDYAALWCKSNYSFLQGASHPEELVEQAHAFGLRALALTDVDGVYGVVRAHVRAQALGLPLIIGAQVSVDTGDAIVLLAENRLGYANLCQLLTQGRLRCEKGKCSISWEEIYDRAAGLFALWSGFGRYGYDATIGESLVDAFTGRLYALLPRHYRSSDHEFSVRLQRQACRLSLPVVAAVEVLYHTPARRPLQDVLTCIRHGIKLHQAGTYLRGNAEYGLQSIAAFARRFEDVPEAVFNSCEVAERCNFSLADLRYRYPAERLPDGRSSAEWLRELTLEGARWRYAGRIDDAVLQQLDRELALIEELDYPGYFLTMWEIVEFCRSHDILCQGRGSAANSAVCYCLGITAVDPVRMDLLFERFLSRERPDPPDIDLDIEHARREEVIQHVYDKYGRGHAAMVANVIRYRSRSAIREVGKVLGLPETALDSLAKLLHRYDGNWAEMLRHSGLDAQAKVHQHLLSLVDEIQDFPRHLSIHPGGFLLGHEPVHDIVPIENGKMADRTVIQWDKDDLDALGLFKVDLLGLGALNVVHHCFNLLKQHQQVDLSLASIPADDNATYDMVCRGDTVGVFQIESRAQMAMLPRLRPRRFYDLVIEVSIVRPGPIAGDMVHPYLRRRHGKEAVTYPHPCLEPVLAKTLGVPLFQEQVIRLAVVAADYTPGEADQLRRDMAAWRRSGRIDRHRQRLISRMQQKGIRREFAERVFEQIRGFGEYGFPESHAASFALIAYATAWLKCHHPAVFTCALLNAQPMGFYTPATLVEDAKRHGVECQPIDVQKSDWDCTLERTTNASLCLRMGLRYVKGLNESHARHAALNARLVPYQGLEDFVRRNRFNEKELTALAETGALESLGLCRRQALWQVRRMVRSVTDSLSLPAEEEQNPKFRALVDAETIAWDYQRSHHSTRGHPLTPLRTLLHAQGLPSAVDLNKMPNGRAVRYAGLAICRQRPGTAKGVLFMTLEDESGFVNLVVWRRVFEQYAIIAKTEAFLGVTGKLQSQDGVVHLVAEKLWIPKLTAQRPANAPSRDFH